MPVSVVAGSGRTSFTLAAGRAELCSKLPKRWGQRPISLVRLVVAHVRREPIAPIQSLPFMSFVHNAGLTGTYQYSIKR